MSETFARRDKKKRRQHEDGRPLSRLKLLAKATKHWEKRFADKKAEEFWAADSPETELKALLSALGEKRGAALDVGCGAGGFTNYLASKGFWPAVGFDMASSGLRLGLAATLDSPRPAFVVAAAPYFPFADAAFDLILDRGCIHVMDESMWPDYISEVERLLAPRGVLHLIERSGHWEALHERLASVFRLEDAFEAAFQAGGGKSIAMVHATLTKVGAEI